MTSSINNNKINRRFPEIMHHMEKGRGNPKFCQKIEEATKELAKVKFYRNSGARKAFSNPITNVINKYTVLAGALKQWDSARLLVGKHAKFKKIGAEHVQLQSSVGDKIDATYISCTSFLSFLKNMGMKKCIFEPKIQAKDLNLYNTSDVLITTPKGKQFEAIKIPVEDISKYELLEKFYVTQGLKPCWDEKGGLYFLSDKGTRHLFLEGFLKDEELTNVVVTDNSSKSKKSTPNADDYTKKINGFYFKQDNDVDKARLDKLKSFLGNLDLVKTQWTFYEASSGTTLFVKRSDLKPLQLCLELDPEMKNVTKTPTLDVATKDGPTVLLSMNQNEVYEQYGSEMITFLLEGINVMSYNNSGKGLSIGSTTKKSIEAAIEVAYQYLHQIKNIPENKIILKGQCFGGAPTAWLGRQHPHTNLIIDQAPANFHETAFKITEKVLSKKIRGTKEGSVNRQFLQLLKSSLQTNPKTAAKLGKAVLLGFNAAEDLKYNQGHILLNVDVPNENGVGGDDLVPEHHTELMINNFPHHKFKNYSLSMNPGGIHVSHWFLKNESYEATTRFLRRSNLTTNIFKPDTVSTDAKKVTVAQQNVLGALRNEAIKLTEKIPQIALEKVDRKQINETIEKMTELEDQYKIRQDEIIKLLSQLGMTIKHSPDLETGEAWRHLAQQPIKENLLTIMILMQNISEIKKLLTNIDSLGSGEKIKLESLIKDVVRK